MSQSVELQPTGNAQVESKIENPPVQSDSSELGLLSAQAALSRIAVDQKDIKQTDYYLDVPGRTSSVAANQPASNAPLLPPALTPQLKHARIATPKVGGQPDSRRDSQPSLASLFNRPKADGKVRTGRTPQVSTRVGLQQGAAVRALAGAPEASAVKHVLQTGGQGGSNNPSGSPKDSLDDDDQMPETEETRLRAKRCGCCRVIVYRCTKTGLKDFDGLEIGVLFLLAILGVSFYFLGRDIELFSNHVWRWGLFLIACDIFYHIAALVEWFLVQVLSLTIGTVIWRVYFYLSVIHNSLRKVLLVGFIMWFRSGSSQAEAYILLPRWIDSLLAPIMAILIAHMFRKIVTKEIIYRINRKSYTEKIEGLLFRETVLETLLKRASYMEVIQAFKGKSPVPQESEGRTVFLRVLNKITDAAQQTLNIGGPIRASETANAIMRNVDRDQNGYLTIEDFRCFFPEKDAKHALDLFEQSDGKVTRKGVLRTVKSFLTDRENLAHNLKSWHNMSGVLQSLFSGIFWFLVAVALIIYYGESFTSVLVSFGTLLLTVSFIFGDALKNVLMSVIFIFVMKPYSIGDRVDVRDIPGEQRFLVHEITLLQTVFRTVHGQLMTLPNYIVMTKPLVNFTRSPSPSFEFLFIVEFNTPLEKLTKFKQAVTDYVATKPEDFEPKVGLFVYDMLRETNGLKLGMWLSSKRKWAEFETVGLARTALCHHIRQLFGELGITYRFNEQPVALVSVTTSQGYPPSDLLSLNNAAMNANNSPFNQQFNANAGPNTQSPTFGAQQPPASAATYVAAAANATQFNQQYPQQHHQRSGSSQQSTADRVAANLSTLPPQW